MFAPSDPAVPSAARPAGCPFGHGRAQSRSERREPAPPGFFCEPTADGGLLLPPHRGRGARPGRGGDRAGLAEPPRRAGPPPLRGGAGGVQRHRAPLRPVRAAGLRRRHRGARRGPAAVRPRRGRAERGRTGRREPAASRRRTARTYATFIAVFDAPGRPGERRKTAHGDVRRPGAGLRAGPVGAAERPARDRPGAVGPHHHAGRLGSEVLLQLRGAEFLHHRHAPRGQPPGPPLPAAGAGVQPARPVRAAAPEPAGTRRCGT